GQRRHRADHSGWRRPGVGARRVHVSLPGAGEPESAAAARPLVGLGLQELEDLNDVTQAPAVPLEIDDIQSGALHERPSPYVGTYFLFRVDDRHSGRELLRRLYPAVDSYRGAASTTTDAW